MSGLRYLSRYVRGHLRIIIIGVFLIIGSNALNLLLPFLVGVGVDTVQRHGATGDIGRVIAWFMLATLVAGAFQLGARYVINSASREVEYDLRNDLFAQFQRIELRYFQDRRLGDLVARAINDMTAIRMFLGPGITNLLNTTFAVLATLIVMVSIDRQLTLYTMVMLPLITIIFLLLDRRIRESFKDVQDQFGVVSAQAQENFSGIRVVKAYAQESAELDAFNATNQEYRRRSIIFTRFYSVLWPAMYLISGITVAILIWRGGVDVINGRITLGQFFQFNALLTQLTWPMIALGWFVNLSQQGQASLARVREIMEYEPTIVDGPEVNHLARIEAGAIALRHVSLRYDEAEVLHDISFNVPAGTSLAIVGATGSGKSSIANLITRTFEPTAGTITIDEQPLHTYSLEELHRAIGYVPQEPFLFSVSIAANIAFGVPDATVAQLEHAADISQLSKDIDDFPDGMQTMIGERGVSLSGGQKQRTGIARAIAKDPRILLLDDSLSSVDTNTEAEILRQLRVVMHGRTAIVISHRISTIKNLDQVIVLEHGRIIERGTHDALIRNGGYYQSMYRRQLMGEELGLESDDMPDLTTTLPSASNAQE